jgi:hypothetical protein
MGLQEHVARLLGCGYRCAQGDGIPPDTIERRKADDAYQTRLLVRELLVGMAFLPKSVPGRACDKRRLGDRHAHPVLLQSIAAIAK